ncbi:uncharacterized protein LOC131330893 isoform X2 [Rhododendron vialii]|uniref:uncharacterized protein LOC131330893 isoform X2 n=1 Tax=Rhododendron vialii TaxID=182163 RepID=UPI00265EADC7|nr:uncharacterized protein LOC131330893 isoform X2 [Rhododendron vialii]
MELLLLQSSAYLHISSCDPSFSCYHCLLLLGNGVGVPCCEPSEPFIRQSTPFPSTDSLFGPCTYLIEMDGITNPKRNIDCKIKRNSQSLLKRVMQLVHTQMMVNYVQLHTSYSAMCVEIGAFPKFTIFT